MYFYLLPGYVQLPSWKFSFEEKPGARGTDMGAPGPGGCRGGQRAVGREKQGDPDLLLLGLVCLLLT